MTDRPTTAFRRLEGVAALVAVTCAVAVAPQGQLGPAALGVLALLAMASELVASTRPHGTSSISGSFMAIVSRS